MFTWTLRKESRSRLAKMSTVVQAYSLTAYLTYTDMTECSLFYASFIKKTFIILFSNFSTGTGIQVYDVAGRYRYRYTTEYLSDWPAQISHESVMWTHLSINVRELHVESCAHDGAPFPSQAGQLKSHATVSLCTLTSASM